MNLAKLCAVGSALLAVAACFGSIKIIAQMKDGDTISGIYTVSARCDSDSTITQVEFYLDGNLVFTDSSTPYEYKIDTIDQKEGPHTLALSAYAENGTSQKLTLKLTIDNKLGLGAKYHADLGNTALRDSKFDDATIEARTALKAQPKFPPALLVLGRAYLGKGVFDEAQNYVEQAIAGDPNDNFAVGILAQVHLRKAFGVRMAALDPTVASSTEKDSMIAAVDTYQKYLQAKLKAIGAPTDANRNDYIDVLLQLGDTSTPRGILQDVVERNHDDVESANTLMYICLRRGDLKEVDKLYQTMVRRKKLDAVTYAQAATAASIRGDDKLADDLIQKALKMERGNLGVKLCQAFITLDRGTIKAATTMAQDIEDNQYRNPEALYYLGRIYYRKHDYDRSRAAYENALLQNPMFSEVYTARGYESLAEARRISADTARSKETIAADVKRELTTAKTFFEVALKARPESAEALIGMGLALGYAPDNKGAAKYGEAALVVAPQIPWVCYAASSLISLVNLERASDILEKVRKENPDLILGSMVPRLKQAHDFVAKWGRTPVLLRP